MSKNRIHKIERALSKNVTAGRFRPALFEERVSSLSQGLLQMEILLTQEETRLLCAVGEHVCGRITKDQSREVDVDLDSHKATEMAEFIRQAIGAKRSPRYFTEVIRHGIAWLQQSRDEVGGTL